MIRSKTEPARAEMEIGAPEDKVFPRKPSTSAWLMIRLAGALAIAFAPRPAAAQAKKARLPYVTIDHPQFIPASQAAFMAPSNMLIGVTDGETSKAYPAAILAQHGIVQDQMADGPIAVTW